MTATIFGVIGAVRYDASFRIGMAETIPWEKTKEPTPRSIFKDAHVSTLTEVDARDLRTNDTPNVSHFARKRGNTGKSTARMQRTVMRSMCARYVVSAGRGTMAEDRTGAERCGRDGRLGLEGDIDGNRVPSGRERRSIINTAAGRMVMNDSHPGLLAKSVTESKSGTTRARNSAGKDIEG
jgi:hypothetical protein